MTFGGKKNCDYPHITVKVFNGANFISAHLYLNPQHSPKTLLIVATGSGKETKSMVNRAYKKIGLRLDKTLGSLVEIAEGEKGGRKERREGRMVEHKGNGSCAHVEGSFDEVFSE